MSRLVCGTCYRGLIRLRWCSCPPSWWPSALVSREQGVCVFSVMCTAPSFWQRRRSMDTTFRDGGRMSRPGSCQRQGLNGIFWRDVQVYTGLPWGLGLRVPTGSLSVKKTPLRHRFCYRNCLFNDSPEKQSWTDVALYLLQDSAPMKLPVCSLPTGGRGKQAV